MLRRIDACAVAFALVFPSLLTWAYFIGLAGGSQGAQQAVYGVGKTLQFVFPILWAAAVQHWRPQWTQPSGKGAAAGLAFGAAVFVAALAAYYAWIQPAGLFDEAADEIRNKVAGFGVHGLPAYVGLGVFYSLCHSFLEEYYWRWFVFGQLRRWMPWRGAAVVSGLGFMAHHVLVLGTYFGFAAPATWGFSLCVAVGGVVWAWMYHRSGSLVGPWLSHLLVDAAIFAVGYDLVHTTL